VRISTESQLDAVGDSGVSLSKDLGLGAMVVDDEVDGRDKCDQYGKDGDHPIPFGVLHIVIGLLHILFGFGSVLDKALESLNDSLNVSRNVGSFRSSRLMTHVDCGYVRS
jgi:hypothetical protein